MENNNINKVELGDNELMEAAGGRTVYVIRYTIRSGDTLSWIAGHYRTTVSEILLVNPTITDANKIYVGQEIYVPYKN